MSTTSKSVQNISHVGLQTLIIALKLLKELFAEKQLQGSYYNHIFIKVFENKAT